MFLVRRRALSLWAAGLLLVAGCSLPATEMRDCPNCKGAGVIDCIGCGGTGNAKVLGPNFQQQGFSECHSCNGKGTFPCGFCSGTGKTLQMVPPKK